MPWAFRTTAAANCGFARVGGGLTVTLGRGVGGIVGVGAGVIGGTVGVPSGDGVSGGDGDGIDTGGTVAFGATDGVAAATLGVVIGRACPPTRATFNKLSANATVAVLVSFRMLSRNLSAEVRVDGASAGACEAR